MLANTAGVPLFVLTQHQRVLESFQQVLYLIVLLGRGCSSRVTYEPFEPTQGRSDGCLHHTAYLNHVQFRCSTCGLKRVSPHTPAQRLFHGLGLGSYLFLIEIIQPVDQIIVLTRVES